MKHSTMKIMSLILALCMIMSLMPMSVLAEGETTHTVTLALTNVTADVTSPAAVTENASYTFTLTPADGYALPASIDVGGTTLAGASTDGDGSANYYNSTSGKVFLASVNGDVTVTAAGVVAVVTHTVTLTLTNVTADPASPITVNDGDNCDITLTPADGYALPTSVTVDGVTLNATSSETPIESANYYDANSGKLHLASVTGNVAVTAAGTTQPAYLVYFLPADYKDYREATADGEKNVEYNICLRLNNYTGGSFGDVQMYDITLNYSDILT